ncbi:MAG TPA: hypothetical protein VFN65_06205, partial [Solirubrobacteraceae bacterium]|nr:hypothetical protein [Solirubrobacteraceae bacterium]
PHQRAAHVVTVEHDRLLRIHAAPSWPHGTGLKGCVREHNTVLGGSWGAGGRWGSERALGVGAGAGGQALGRRALGRAEVAEGRAIPGADETPAGNL